MIRRLLFLFAFVLMLIPGSTTAWAQTGSWQPAEVPLMSRWADEVSPEAVQERPYPRPQMKRPRWKTLNGLWQYAIRSDDTEAPQTYDGEILVPFPIESALSGVGEQLPEEKHLWYRRRFEVPADWAGERLFLHFGAVDWEATVFVNGQQVGQHKGGYDPFTFDIAGALKENGPQELALRVFDPTDQGTQPRGKQVRDPQGIWYTPVTGIWQTVWLEPVPQEASIQSLKMVPDINENVLRLTVKERGAAEGLHVEAIARDQAGRVVGRVTGTAAEPLAVPVPEARLWSPNDPYLYDLVVRLTDGEATVDEVDSYFGMRSVTLGEGKDGKTRLLLNGEPLFQYGPLDQGYWPGGLYTAPTDEALRFDLEITKQLGFNMSRKHVKVEPRRWYYWADRLGVLVWQDMPNADLGRIRRGQKREEAPPEEAARQFEEELKEVTEDYYNHPSIVMWVIFNEGWGQYDTKRITDLVREWDPSRLIDNPSGWADREAGDVIDMHNYPGPGSPEPESGRAAVLGEFGGLGLPTPAHTWQDQENWGYRSYEDPAALTTAYLDLLDKLRLLRGEPGLSAAVYTQLTDVETEVNGLLTYDRDVAKMNTYHIAQANRRLYEDSPPSISVITPTAEQEHITWHYTTTKPREGWIQPHFDTSDWKQGPGGFGKSGTPGAEIGTEWTSSDLWVRRTFTREAGNLQSPHLRIHHDDDATVYLNGKRIAELDRWTSNYTLLPLDEQAREAFREGRNTLAIHVHQRGGGQYIDAGFVDVTENATERPSQQ